MSNAIFFKRLGLFVLKDFISAQLCMELKAEMKERANPQATVFAQGSYQIDESIRKTKSADVSKITIDLIQQRLLTIKPDVEQHFQLSLGGCEKPQFLVYKEGDFFRLHRDSGTPSKVPVHAQRRQVSLIIFLNSENCESLSDSYSGGSLFFFGLFEDPRLQQVGFPCVGEAGMLLAFRSDSFHEVKPVIKGERYTIVSWFFA